MTRAQSGASMARFQTEFEERGFGWWAVEVRATGEFVGFAGLDVVAAGPLRSNVVFRIARPACAAGQ